MTYAKTRVLIVLAASAIIGATAIAFASDMIGRRDLSNSFPTAVTQMSNDGDACEANTCTIVVKSTGPGATSQVINVH